MNPISHHDAVSDILPAGARAPRRAEAYADVEPLGPDCIDGSQAGLNRFLREMAQLAGEDSAALTVQLGEIVVIAMPALEGGMTIAAQLPRGGTQRVRQPAPAGCELAWHADLGCEVMVRHLGLAALRAEPDVLDALMDSAAMARALVA